jgi:iron-sulfur cluster assembly protein
MATAEIDAPEGATVTPDPIVTLTAGAVRQVVRQQQRTGRVGAYLRLGVRGGGCSGLSYVIDMEDSPDPEFDLEFKQDGLRIVIDRKSALYLNGSTLDYNIKNLMEGGFVFTNPHAVRSCGCGTSFTAR